MTTIYHLWRLGVVNSKKPLLHRTGLSPSKNMEHNII